MTSAQHIWRGSPSKIGELDISGEDSIIFSQTIFYFFSSLIQIRASVHALEHMTICERSPSFLDDPIGRLAAMHNEPR
jgi:hypothetical protein